MNCWETGWQVNMQQFMKAISVPVADSLFMIESVILFWIINMEINLFKF